MLKIINWSSYQSYKDRKPPWIRFHKSMLDNYEFHIMSTNARAILPMLWLLASEDSDPTSGLIRDSYKKIAFRLRCSEQEIISAVEECSENDFIEVIEKHDESKSVTTSLRIRNEKVTFFQDSVTPETETETETETEKKLTKKIYDFSGFDDFWNKYGKIGNKHQASKAYESAIKKGASHGEIIEGVGKYQESCRSVGTDRKFIKHAATWINNRGWEDEYTIASSAINPEPVKTRSVLVREAALRGLLSYERDEELKRVQREQGQVNQDSF